MREWYYVIEGEARGPVDETELTARFKDAGLPSDTLVWADGMDEWVAAGRCRELQLPEVPVASADGQDRTIWKVWADGPQVRPWVRYWARSIDLSFFSFLAAPLLAAVLRGDTPSRPYLVVFGISLAYVFVEPLIIARFGTTPGKALLHTRIRTVDGATPSYRQALRRSFEVWIRGIGMGLPILTVVAHAFSYVELTRRGVTSWDNSGGFVVQHAPIGRTRALLAAAYLLSIVVMAASTLGG